MDNMDNMDELYLDNIDEFVNDHNKIVSARSSRDVFSCVAITHGVQLDGR